MNETTQAKPRNLLLLRHAKSSWSDPGLTDFQRTLNARGQRDAPLIGRQLRQENTQVDIILASTAQRVRETIGLLLDAWQFECPIVWEKQLYLATPDTLIHQLSTLDDQWSRAMIVGHNPGLSDLAGLLTGNLFDMPTASLAMLSHPEQSWATAMRFRDWHQYAYWKPKDID